MAFFQPRGAEFLAVAVRQVVRRTVDFDAPRPIPGFTGCLPWDYNESKSYTTSLLLGDSRMATTYDATTYDY